MLASLLFVGASVAQAVNIAQNKIVNPDPANWTPNVLDGVVYTFVQIGTKIFAGGSFTQVQASSGGTINPSMPSRTSSALPPTSVAMTGVPNAIASRTTFGVPS